MVQISNIGSVNLSAGSGHGVDYAEVDASRKCKILVESGVTGEGRRRCQG